MIDDKISSTFITDSTLDAIKELVSAIDSSRASAIDSVVPIAKQLSNLSDAILPNISFMNDTINELKMSVVNMVDSSTINLITSISDSYTEMTRQMFNLNFTNVTIPVTVQNELESIQELFDVNSMPTFQENIGATNSNIPQSLSKTELTWYEMVILVLTFLMMIQTQINAHLSGAQSEKQHNEILEIENAKLEKLDEIINLLGSHLPNIQDTSEIEFESDPTQD